MKTLTLISLIVLTGLQPAQILNAEVTTFCDKITTDVIAT